MWRNRIIYACLWVLSVVLISFYGGPVSYGIFYLLTIIPVVNLIYLIYVYFFFHLYQKTDSKWLVADETYPFYFTLVNDYHIVFAGIRVRFYDDFSVISGLDESREYEFFPKSGITLETAITCKCRGEYEVGIRTVVIEDYLRLFAISYKNREPLKVIVRPKIVKLDSIKDIDNAISNRESRTQNEYPDVLTREYVANDDIRQIHWPATAKTGKPVVRLKTGDEQTESRVILINRRISDDPRVYLPCENKMLETALAVTLYLAGTNVPVTHFHGAVEPVIKTVNIISEFPEYYDMISAVSFEKELDSSAIIRAVSSGNRQMSAGPAIIIVNGFDLLLAELTALFVRHNTDTLIYYVGSEIPDDLGALNTGRIKVICIPPDADLAEVIA